MKTQNQDQFTQFTKDIQKKNNLDIISTSQQTFYSSGLNSFLIQCLKQMHFINPTPIQYYSISTSMKHNNKSMIAQSKSGTGKTLSYMLIVYQSLLEISIIKQFCHCLIILPTRELAYQVFQNFKTFQNTVLKVKGRTEDEKSNRAKIRDISLMLAIGGIPFEDDKYNFIQNGGNIIIGTVGRVTELVNKNVLKIKQLDVLVLDEGDKLFESKNQPFMQLINQINSTKTKSPSLHLTKQLAQTNTDQIPNKTRFLIYSATYTEKLIKQLMKKRSYIFIQTLANKQQQMSFKITQNPLSFSFQEKQNKIEVMDGANSTANSSEELINLENIKKYKILICPSQKSMFNSKIQQLILILRQLEYSRCLIFVEKKAFLQQINERLISSELNPLLIHGSLSQSSRIKVMNQINNSKIIIASDLLARGIDLRLDLVILFDAKRNDTFWHRIGRTGRFGRLGVAISLDDVDSWEVYSKELVQKHLTEINQQENFSKKQWYGQYSTDLGNWADVEPEKQQFIAQTQKYRYVEEQQVRIRLEPQKQLKQIQNSFCLKEQKCPKSHLQSHKKIDFSNKSELIELLINVMRCPLCKRFMKEITELTGYTFQIAKYYQQNYECKQIQ